MIFSIQYLWPVLSISEEAIDRQSLGCGDVFYDHSDAYTASWSKALQSLNCMLQIDAIIEEADKNQNSPLLKISVFSPNSERTALIFEKIEEINYIELKYKLGWQQKMVE